MAEHRASGLPHAQAVSPFKLDKFEPEPAYAQDEGVTYGRVQISKTFTGDLEGQSQVAMLALRADPDGAGYVALERIEGALQGRRGTFALLHIGTMTGLTPWAKWPIVPGRAPESSRASRARPGLRSMTPETTPFTWTTS